MYFVSHVQVLDPTDGAKQPNLKTTVGQKYKSSILKPTIRLKCSNFINGISGLASKYKTTKSELCNHI